mmetsp:Transcript_11137/g.11160  ORF Transcript_11137/g.11160 Transcript_11137/m.11160 type:complete len:313 (+) Transcript_11137:178-1116(+)|eukprot:CAMPEP_0182422312 /NCGR_PEP_ID=MMETSP1167-20130531/7968_1 /TAXON_ID=2988 /ORGANISM="Mallomonas Sp, Strain CCMP3275" /LENGTH=312 /DNA_ID=CAMNT_0024600273 /DNA_START=162 /DNA_END=1100 /DNA_ORIENTATION=+
MSSLAEMNDKDGDNSYGDDLESIINFVFPPILQHPLAAARLVCYGQYGPLVNSELRSGRQGKHKITTWELNTMCLQIEREDLLQIYLHKGQKFELLNKLEQDAMINQADMHLKKAKGKASLPQITKDDIRELLSTIPPVDEYGTLSFHEVQNKIFAFRDERIKKYKLIYPNLATTTGREGDGENNRDMIRRTCKPYSSMKGTRVSGSVADPCMFTRGVGQSDPDRIAETSKLLSINAYKICDVEASSNPSLTSNVRLLREVGPVHKDPYVTKDGRRVKNSWNDTSNMTATQVGSLVSAAPSSSTWKRKATLG